MEDKQGMETLGTEEIKKKYIVKVSKRIWSER